jgi:hypothetical protein
VARVASMYSASSPATRQRLHGRYPKSVRIPCYQFVQNFAGAICRAVVDGYDLQRA